MAGISTEPMAATSATAEPEISAKNSDTPTFTIARPPRMKPISADVKSISRREMPPVFISAPAKMNNGMAMSGKLVAPSNMTRAALYNPGTPFCHNIPTKAAAQIDTPMGTLITIRTNSRTRTTVAIICPAPLRLRADLPWQSPRRSLLVPP